MNAAERDLLRETISSVRRAQVTEVIPLDQDLWEKYVELQKKCKRDRERGRSAERRLRKQVDEWRTRAYAAERAIEKMTRPMTDEDVSALWKALERASKSDLELRKFSTELSTYPQNLSTGETL